MAQEKEKKQKDVKKKKQSIKKKKNHTTVGDKLGKLKLLCIIVDRKISDRFIFLLQENGINIVFSTNGKGTSKSDFYSAIGIDGGNKTVIFCTILEHRENEILDILNEKFEKIKSKKRGIAFTVDFSSVIGVSTYQVLANRVK